MMFYSTKNMEREEVFGKEHSPDSCMETCTDGIIILVFRGTFISLNKGWVALLRGKSITLHS
jgi:hypothetical protein